MKKARKVLAVIVAFCMVAVMIVYPVHLENTKAAEVSGDFEYETLADGTVSITKYNGKKAYLMIPEKIADQTVSAIGERAFENCQYLEEVVVPSYVTSIGDKAFFGCGKLKEIAVDDDYDLRILESIGDYAFSGCQNLIGIYIAGDVESIGAYVASDCQNLKWIAMTGDVGNIGDYAFSDCQNLAWMQAEGGVNGLGKGTFSNCRSLEHVYMSKTIKEIKEKTFVGCNKLETVNYDGTWEQWQQIVIADGNELLGTANVQIICGSPHEAQSYRYVELGNGTMEIKEYTGDEPEIIIPSELDGKSVFKIDSFFGSGRVPLESITIPSSVSEVGHFNGQSLKNIYVEEGNKNFISEDGVLFNKDKTKLVYYPSGKEGAYNIPAGVTEICDEAFYGCRNLTEVTLPSSVEKVGWHALSECPKLENIWVDEENKHYVSEKGILFNIDKTEIVRYPSARRGAYHIPDGITRIHDSAFYECENLTEVTLPNGVKNIGEEAFCYCNSLKEVTFPVGVENIGIGIFSCCENLNNVTFPEGVKKIPDETFFNCSSLKSVIFPDSITEIGSGAFVRCDNVEKISIPGGVTKLADYAFGGCQNLTEVQILEGMTQINMQAFRRCGNLKSIIVPVSVTRIIMELASSEGMEQLDQVKDVYYGGSKEQWEQIDVPYAEDSLSVQEKLRMNNAVIHFADKIPDIEPEPEETILPAVSDAKEELEQIKTESGKPISLEDSFGKYMTNDQMDALESYLYTWLAEVNYAYKYPKDQNNDIRARIMKKVGIDPEGDFEAGTEQAVTHISVETIYGPKIFEITMELGKPDSSGNLYPSFGSMQYKILDQTNIPSDVPTGGQIGKGPYTGVESFIESVSKAAEVSLNSAWKHESMFDEQTAGVLVDRTMSEMIGNKNGSFSDGVFTLYKKPLDTYKKKVTISGDVQVYIYDMNGTEVATIINNHPVVKEETNTGIQAGDAALNIRLSVDENTHVKTIIFASEDYYIELKGKGMTGTTTRAAKPRGAENGTISYQVEEIANEEVRRTVQFLELQLQKDMWYSGYVFRPLNIDSDLYLLQMHDSTGNKEPVYKNEDSYKAMFKQVENLSISSGKASMESEGRIQLVASLSPLDASNPSLQWKTDNESVVSVDKNGLVTAVGAGSTTVTVSTKDGSFLKQYCVIDVKKKSNDIVPGGDSDSNETETGGGSSLGSGSGENTGETGKPGNNGAENTGGSSSGNSGNTGNNSNTGNSGSSGSSGSSSGSSSGNYFDNSSNNSGNSPDNSKPSLEPEISKTPETPSVVAALHYVLQFQTNGGINLSRKTMTLLADDNPGIMPKIQRKGYVFDGWYTQQYGGEQVTGDQPLKAATTLYAHWSKAKVPKKLSVPMLKSKKKGQMKVSFKKVEGAVGYQLQYSTKKKFTSKKTENLGASAKGYTISGLQAGKKYYTRVRAYSTDSMGNKIYGKYSKAKSVKIKS